ncbi:hypothetical protein [Stomatohabitans albus]|uniref:hypothetical protein n=1 Tax=Stomatohabitans albus TaxID=3110766 RepID=UPI00300D570C
MVPPTSLGDNVDSTSPYGAVALVGVIVLPGAAQPFAVEQWDVKTGERIETKGVFHGMDSFNHSVGLESILGAAFSLPQRSD